MARNGGYGGRDGGAGGDGGRGPVFIIVLLIVIAAVFGGNAFAQDLLKGGLGVLKALAIIFGVGIVLTILVAIGFAWWTKKKEQQNKEAEQTAQILNAPLDTFADLETQQLMDKYDGKPVEQAEDKKTGRETVNPYSAKKNMYEDGERVQSGK